MNDLGRKPKDRDFLRTVERMFFCVAGYLHPPQRFTAYLKYSPTAEGKWTGGGTAYRRELPYYHVQQVARTVDALEERHPEYVHDCPVRGFRFSMVPRDRVAYYYRPEDRLQEILSEPRDSLEEEVRDLALELAASAGIHLTALGITGSVLIGIHNPGFSDIDLTVYGLGNAWKIREVLRGGMAPGVHPFSQDFVVAWSGGIARRFPLEAEDAQYFATRRWNYGTYNGRYFSLHPIRADNEITEQYGDHIYRGHSSALVRAVVVDVTEALFMPAKYSVRGVEVLEGNPRAAEVEELVSYEGLYRDIVDDGGLVEARGWLESVDGEPRRLVIGSMAMGGQGFIKPMRAE